MGFLRHRRRHHRIPDPLYLDEFLTLEAHPIADGAAEPGPGTRNTNISGGSDGEVSINGSEQLVITNPTTGQGYPNLYHEMTEELSNFLGLVHGIRFKVETSASGFQVVIVNDDGLIAPGWRVAGTSQTQFNTAAGWDDVWGSFTLNEVYDVALINDGARWMLAVKSTTDFPSYTILYPGGFNVDPSETKHLVSHLRFNNFDSGPITIDHLMSLDRSAAFTNRFAQCSDVRVIPVSGEVMTCPADFWIEIPWEPQVGETLTVLYRRTDDDNCMKLTIAEGASGTIELFERTAGSDVSQGSGTVDTRQEGRVLIRAFGDKHWVSWEPFGGDAVTVLNNLTSTHEQTTTGAKWSSSASNPGLGAITTRSATLSGSSPEDIAPTSIRAIPDNSHLAILITDIHANVADSQYTTSPGLRDLATYLNALGTACLINPGDNAHRQGNSADVQSFKDNFEDLLVMTRFHLRGNHDEEQDENTVGDGDFTTYDGILPAVDYPYHGVVDWVDAQVRFICFHTEIIHTPDPNIGFFKMGTGGAHAAEQTWIEARFADRPSGYKVILVSHAPSNATHGNNIHASEGGTNLLSWIDSNNTVVRAHISGHRHFNNAVVVANGIEHIVGIHTWGLPGGGRMDGGFNIMEYVSGTDKILFHKRASERFHYGEYGAPIEIDLSP